MVEPPIEAIKGLTYIGDNIDNNCFEFKFLRFYFIYYFNIILILFIITTLIFRAYKHQNLLNFFNHQWLLLNFKC